MTPKEIPSRKLWKVVRVPPFLCISPHGGKIWIFKSYRRKIQSANPIRNLTLNNFDLHNRFNIPDGLKDMGVPNRDCITINHKPNNFRAVYLSTIGDMELITERKIIQNKNSG